jgi:DNA gyrase/topoisomerase IV subunit A
MKTTQDSIKKTINKSETISQRNAKELEELAKKLKYDRIRFFIAPDKEDVSLESIIDDARIALKSVESTDLRNIILSV